MLDTLSLHGDSGEETDFTEFGRVALTENEFKTESVMLNSVRLSAMGHWLKTMTNLVMYPTSAPTLLVRATVLVAGLEVDERPTVPGVDTIRTIAADHFSMATQESAVTAQMIEEWLGTQEAVRSVSRSDAGAQDRPL
jgi:hypothetical protein